ncbi:hypothetical protein D3C80_803770 [compost metagenome]
MDAVQRGVQYRAGDVGVAGEGVGEACAAGWGVVRRNLFSTCEIERRSAHQLGLGVQWGGNRGTGGFSGACSLCRDCPRDGA